VILNAENFLVNDIDTKGMITSHNSIDRQYNCQRKQWSTKHFT